MLIFLFSLNLLERWISGAILGQSETVMGEKTENEPQNLLMNPCTQQILLKWQIDLLELHPIPAIATHDAHMKGLQKLRHQHIPVDDIYD